MVTKLSLSIAFFLMEDYFYFMLSVFVCMMFRMNCSLCIISIINVIFRFSILFYLIIGEVNF